VNEARDDPVPGAPQDDVVEIKSVAPDDDATTSTPSTAVPGVARSQRRRLQGHGRTYRREQIDVPVREQLIVELYSK
jgi:hypothetical protein